MSGGNRSCVAGGPIVYRLGRYPFKVERRVRLPLGLSIRRSWDSRCRQQVLDGESSIAAMRGCLRDCRTVASRDVGGRSSVWLEHSTVTREVAGSSPVGPVGCRSSMGSQVQALTGRARPGGETGRHAILRGWCRKASRFESAPGHPGCTCSGAPGHGTRSQFCTAPQ